MRYSVVIPVYNEEESIQTLFGELRDQMEKLGEPYEVIFVNDASSDGTPRLLQSFQENEPSVVRIVHLRQRSGQTRALRKGLDEARGRTIITLDADLQNDPADIPVLLKKMREGYAMVCGWRKARQDTFLKARLSKTGNFFQRLLTGLKIHDVSCTLRVFEAEHRNKIRLEWEGAHRFIPLFLVKEGLRVGEIVCHHRPRRFGQSKYTHKRLPKVVTDFFRIYFH